MQTKPINLNEQARRVAEREGGKINLPIAQVKQVMRLLYEDLARHDPIEVLLTVQRHRAELAEASPPAPAATC